MVKENFERVKSSKIRHVYTGQNTDRRLSQSTGSQQVLDGLNDPHDFSLLIHLSYFWNNLGRNNIVSELIGLEGLDEPELYFSSLPMLPTLRFPRIL